ncbi:NAD(P)-dependent oxidoreductase [Amycolatopsis acidicola]|uniref:NAD(P)-dependent oxidoreductase n=1 Tax=Amycolatopsis acidicola TaxID=2596893 RepID=A0A5N0UU53_9PSEU|nr:NAD(P)-dependent oxidoreductase [Amycolatopsis acidicola]KAA9156002.1 NAD(P)-dependent oxidoreductase [Amycolatopsis acidicola]
MSAPSVAVLGLGPMGAPVAAHIAGAGFPLQVWNRTRAKAKAFGDKAIATPADVRAEIVLSVLPDVDQFDEIAPGPVVRAWAAHGTRYVVVLSTTSRDKIHALAGRLGPSGIAVADAPMSGGDAGARAGELSLMVGAGPETYAAIEPVLRSFSAVIEHLGPPGAGTVAKLCNQVVVASTLVGVAEAFDLARRAGIPGAQLARVLRAGLASSAVLDAKAPKILGREYSLGGSSGNQLKDLRYAIALADELGARLSQARQAGALFTETVHCGLADADHSAVYEVVSADEP